MNVRELWPHFALWGDGCGDEAVDVLVPGTQTMAMHS